MPRNILSLQDLRKSFGNLHALDAVSLDVRESKLTILIGPNRSGKTTLINIINELYTTDSSTASIEDKNLISVRLVRLYVIVSASIVSLIFHFCNVTV